ncbi:MAG: RluA family pseudouridine synthase [Candidatus Krumholzibacteriia bacterium]
MVDGRAPGGAGDGERAKGTPQPPAPLRLTADPEAAGERLDAYLAAHVTDLSRTRIQAALAAGRVQVDGRARPKNHRLRGGEQIVLEPLPRAEMSAVPERIPLEVVHEDEVMLVVNKPAGLVVHPAPGHAGGTLVNALLHRYPHLGAAGSSLRPGIVHRLDRDTSGLLVVALTEQAHAHLAAQLRRRTLGRRYLALSWGRWPAGAGELTSSLGRHPRHRKRMAVVVQGGREALTRYRVEEDFSFCQLCTVELGTGRTHQIRVHFSHHGHPVVGDPTYGDDRRARGVPAVDRALAAWVVRRAQRQLLHAAELRLTHPVTGEPRVFQAPPPPDLAEILAELRRRL